MIELTEWIRTRRFPARPWLVLGKGPTFDRREDFDLGRYNLLALNHVVRALKVVRLTGRPFSASLPSLEYLDPMTVQVGVDCDRETLDRRIALRVDQMWERGLVAEVERLVGEGLREGRTARSALGYAQVLDLLDGRITEDEARESTVRGTRRFVRRQESWFRKDPRVAWVPWTNPVPTAIGAIRTAVRAVPQGAQSVAGRTSPCS